MKINKDASIVSNAFGSIPTSNIKIEVLGTGANNQLNAHCKINDVTIDTTSSNGLTLLILQKDGSGSNYTIKHRVRYNTQTNPNAGKVGTTESLYYYLRNMLVGEVFVIYSYGINTAPSAFDTNGTHTIPVTSPYTTPIDIHMLFKALGSRLWGTIHRINNNQREKTPFSCIGVCTTNSIMVNVDFLNAKITHEAIGSIITGADNPHALLVASFPYDITTYGHSLVGYNNLNPIGNTNNEATTYYGPIPLDTTPHTNATVSNIGVGISFYVGWYSTTPTYTTTTSNITVSVVNAQGNSVFTQSFTSFTPTHMDIKIPAIVRNASGQLRLVVSRFVGQQNIKTYISNAIWYRYVGSSSTSSKVSVSRSGILSAKGFVSSNIGGKKNSTVYQRGVKKVGTLFNSSVVRRLADDSSAIASEVAPYASITSNPVDIVENTTNNVLNIISSANPLAVTIYSADENGNITPNSLQGNGVVFNNGMRFTYDASASTVSDNSVRYAHKAINIPLVGVGSDKSKMLGTYSSLTDRLPSNGVRPYVEISSLTKKIIVVITNSSDSVLVFKADIIPMMVGFSSDGIVFGNITT